ncbi:MAG: phosphopantothenoylcysteine decarboxylase [Planctomycetaceae bacterium]|jgi:phosphopantothenoylcysteine decarboxylase/phosphopantothenate--cysteine ligase|nr:phosphopantothenoylcysteine decarboxylase [Planctomycetaceae bacterium]
MIMTKNDDNEGSDISLRVLVTSGPTREYFDPVRFLSNGSSGKMGAAIAIALIEFGFEPVVVSGVVDVSYPVGATVYFVETTREMLDKCLEIWGGCVGVIGAAAPCDYRPKNFSLQKIAKSEFGDGLFIELEQTEDVLGALGGLKRVDQWSVGFALETGSGRSNAMAKLRKKNCDFIVLNSPESINNDSANLQVFNTHNELIATLTGTKTDIAKKLIQSIKGISIP